MANIAVTRWGLGRAADECQSNPKDKDSIKATQILWSLCKNPNKKIHQAVNCERTTANSGWSSQGMTAPQVMQTISQLCLEHAQVSASCCFPSFPPRPHIPQSLQQGGGCAAPTIHWGWRQCQLLPAFQKESATSANLFNKCLTLTHLLAAGPKNRV